MQDKLNKDELIKSLQDLEFSEEEISDIVSKAEKEDKLSKEDEKPVTDPKEYEGDDDKKEEDTEEDKDDMKKAYDKIMSMKEDIDKSMTAFLDKFGKVPGLTTPTDFVKKSEEVEIEKSLDSKPDVIEKAFGDKFTEISKAFSEQAEVNSEILKSLKEMHSTVNAIAETPNPYKGLFGSYRNSIIEKGGKDENVVSLRDKNEVIDAFEKAINKVSDEKDKNLIRDMISTFTISGITSPTGLDIVKKALNIDFEK